MIDMSNITLYTNRLILRPFAIEDARDVFEYASDLDVGPMAGWNPHQTIEDSIAIVDQFISEKKVFAIEYQGKVIGSLGLEPLKNDLFLSELGRELGFVLGKPYWGQGLMVEAVNRVSEYCFNEIDLEYLVCRHYEFNLRSKRVIEKCGFVFLESEIIQSKIHGEIVSMSYVLLR